MSSSQLFEKKTKIVFKGDEKDPQKATFLHNLAMEELVAPKSFDYKNYFQSNQFKIQ